MRSIVTIFVFAALMSGGTAAARAETPEEWVALGARVHGGYGAFIPLGIKIGLDAVDRLKAKPRELSVTYYDGEKSPCACFADGVAIATSASVGQRSLKIDPEKGCGGRHRDQAATGRPGIQIHNPVVGVAAAWKDEHGARSARPP